MSKFELTYLDLGSATIFFKYKLILLLPLETIDFKTNVSRFIRTALLFLHVSPGFEQVIFLFGLSVSCSINIFNS